MNTSLSNRDPGPLGPVGGGTPPPDIEQGANQHISGHTAPSAVLDIRPAAGKVEHDRKAFTGWKERFYPGRPDPWLHMKFGVIIVYALVIWSFYVIVGRVCVPMIQKKSSSGLGRAVGAGTLVGYLFLWLMAMWTYTKMIVTGPGFAVDRVPRSPPPQTDETPAIPFDQPPPSFHQSNPPSNPANGPLSVSFQNRQSSSAPMDATSSPHQEASSHDNMMSDPSGPNPSEFAPVTNLIHNGLHRADSRRMSSSATLAPEAAHEGKIKTGKSKVTDWREVQRPVPRVEHGPRWCRHCEINKPDRTHHCRHCGTCVLQFDHHCLWIGQCVGHHNHKDFIIFNFWGALYCFYMIILLVIYVTKDYDVDGQAIGLIAVSALFGLFNSMMLGTHINLICTGRSTVESFSGRDQSEREATVLQREYGYLWHNQQKRKVQKRWKEEWGGSEVDARWKWGSNMDMWKQEMGNPWTGWILPIGRPEGDGVVYAQNPRFGPHGEWLQKKDWPAGVQ